MMDNEEKKELTGDETLVNRNLGDEWAEWVGDLNNYEKEIEEGKNIFLFFYFLSLSLFFGISCFIYYLVAPRLYSFHPYVELGFFWLIMVIFVSVFFWSILMLLTVLTNINFMPMRKKSGLAIDWIYPAVYKIAGMFGISKDRVGHSLVEVNNAIVYAARKKFKAQNLLVLLPRCLDKETRVKVTEITQKYGCTVFTATGGSSARKMVQTKKPDAIIGVACERDLVSGMSDSPKKITVIGIPNKRPFGPCKDTTIDTAMLEHAIRFLLKI